MAIIWLFDCVYFSSFLRCSIFSQKLIRFFHQYIYIGGVCLMDCVCTLYIGSWTNQYTNIYIDANLNRLKRERLRKKNVNNTQHEYLLLRRKFSIFKANMFLIKQKKENQTRNTTKFNVLTHLVFTFVSHGITSIYISPKMSNDIAPFFCCCCLLVLFVFL